MPHDPRRVAEVREWLTKARDDLVGARTLVNSSPPLAGLAAFHSQQASVHADLIASDGADDSARAIAPFPAGKRKRVRGQASESDNGGQTQEESSAHRRNLQ